MHGILLILILGGKFIRKNKYCIIKTTYKNKKEAKIICKILLDSKLIACAQIHKIESIYFWENTIMNEPEFLLGVNTTSCSFNIFLKLIAKNHSYKNPEIIQIEINDGSKDYFVWLEDCLR